MNFATSLFILKNRTIDIGWLLKIRTYFFKVQHRYISFCIGHVEKNGTMKIACHGWLILTFMFKVDASTSTPTDRCDILQLSKK